MRYFIKLSMALFCAVACILPVGSEASELVSLKTRPGVTQHFILIEPDQTVASVIVFAGGHGNLGLKTQSGLPTMKWGKNNFVVRTRHRLAAQGFTVAVVDAPSDKKGKKGMRGGFRNSKKHVIDIDQVIRFLRNKKDAPVWLVGTSRGTESATRIAISSSETPDGLVLTSSMSIPNKSGTAVTQMELDRIQIPTLIVAHREDGCKHTPPKGAETIKKALSNAQRAEVKYFSGGKKPKSKPCQALSAHGFFGIEDDVVSEIARFIKTNR